LGDDSDSSTFLCIQQHALQHPMALSPCHTTDRIKTRYSAQSVRTSATAPAHVCNDARRQSNVELCWQQQAHLHNRRSSRPTPPVAASNASKGQRVQCRDFTVMSLSLGGAPRSAVAMCALLSAAWHVQQSANNTCCPFFAAVSNSHCSTTSAAFIKQ